MESLRDQEVACSASDRQGSNFEFCAAPHSSSLGWSNFTEQIVIYLKSCADLILCENYSHIIIHNLSGQYFGMYPNSTCSQNAVSAYFTIKHILHFGFAEISWPQHVVIPMHIISNTRRWTNAGLKLAHRLRRWPNINPALVQRLVFAGTGIHALHPVHYIRLPTMLEQCWASVSDAGPVLIHSYSYL